MKQQGTRDPGREKRKHKPREEKGLQWSKTMLSRRKITSAKNMGIILHFLAAMLTKVKRKQGKVISIIHGISPNISKI